MKQANLIKTIKLYASFSLSLLAMNACASSYESPVAPVIVQTIVERLEIFTPADELILTQQEKNIIRDFIGFYIEKANNTPLFLNAPNCTKNSDGMQELYQTIEQNLYDLNLTPAILNIGNYQQCANTNNPLILSFERIQIKLPECALEHIRTYKKGNAYTKFGCTQMSNLLAMNAQTPEQLFHPYKESPRFARSTAILSAYPRNGL